MPAWFCRSPVCIRTDAIWLCADLHECRRIELPRFATGFEVSAWPSCVVVDKGEAKKFSSATLIWPVLLSRAEDHQGAMSICAEPGVASETGNNGLDGAHRHRRLAAADKKSCDFAQRLAMFKVLLGASTRHSAIAQGGQPWRRCSGRAVCRCLTMPQLYSAGLAPTNLQQYRAERAFFAGFAGTA
jgi:hypothetical protein